MHLLFLVLVYLIAVLVVAAGGVYISRQRRSRLSTSSKKVMPAPPGTLTARGGEDEKAASVVTEQPPVDNVASVVSSDVEEREPPKSLSAGLSKTRGVIGAALSRMKLRGGLSEEFWSELEETLILGDIGLEISRDLVSKTRDAFRQTGLNSSVEAIDLLRRQMLADLEGKERSLTLFGEAPNLVLLVGVNGVGKTTTIGKLANYLTSRGSSVILAAGDTFRAAASEQLEQWANAANVEIVKGSSVCDPASVIFDAASRAKAIGADVVIADTAGRLQTSSNLMGELAKIHRVAQKAPGTLSEVLLVVDATTGQNGLSQAKSFSQAAQTTGVVLTKLDGSAKGGIAFAIERELGIPIKFVGTGEKMGDLVPFDPATFVDEICG